MQLVEVKGRFVIGKRWAEVPRGMYILLKKMEIHTFCITRNWEVQLIDFISLSLSLHYHYRVLRSFVHCRSSLWIGTNGDINICPVDYKVISGTRCGNDDDMTLAMKHNLLAWKS